MLKPNQFVLNYVMILKTEKLDQNKIQKTEPITYPKNMNGKKIIVPTNYGLSDQKM